MGSRGSSSGVSDTGKPYGSEYHTVFQMGNIKFVQANDTNHDRPPDETMTKGRVYAYLNKDGVLKSVVYFDENNKKFKTVEIVGPEHIVSGHREQTKPYRTSQHTHFGYIHDEKGTDSHSPKEKKMIERVTRALKYHNEKHLQ